MKIGLAVTLMLATACSGNRTEAPAQQSEATSPPAEIAAAPPSAVATPATAPQPTEVATTTTTPTPVIPDPAPVQETERAAEPPPPPPPPVPAAQKAIDPLELLRESEAKRADYQQKLAAAEAKLVAADAAIGEWQNTVLAFKNPFRPRPSLSAEEAQAIEGKDGVSRVAWAEGKLAEARTARDTAQKDLDYLKANPQY